MRIEEWGWVFLGVVLWLWDHVAPKTGEGWVALFLAFVLIVAWQELMGKLDTIIAHLAGLDKGVRALTTASKGKDADDDFTRWRRGLNE